jgi:pimeloyl-ACP methyl ester carboxylesterase
MGIMIAAKLASASPSRVASLTLISAAGGGWHCLPASWKALKYGWQVMRAQSKEARARADLKLHFTRRARRMWVSG